MMGIVECKRMFLVIQSGSNNTPRRDDLHPSPFSDITMLLRKQGRAVTNPWPTIMLKLYFARHTLIFGTVWDLLRGRIFDFWTGGYGLFYIYISCRLILRRKNSWKEILGEKNSRKICFTAYNAEKKSYPRCMSWKKIYPPTRGFGGKIVTQAKSYIPPQKSNGRPLITLAMAYM